jgi:hypothetical protein
MVRTILLAILAASTLGAQDFAWAAPTFESLGLYYDRDAARDACRPRYRRIRDRPAAAAVRPRNGAGLHVGAVGAVLNRRPVYFRSSDRPNRS